MRRSKWKRAGVCVVRAAVVGLYCASPLLAVPTCPTKDCDPALLGRRTLVALRIVGAPPVIDGKLDEPAWNEAPVATDFVEASPKPGVPASLRSEARVLVDEKAMYIGLRYDDPDPGRILAPLARRDDETTSDWAFVELDTRHDRRTGFSFGVNPKGVQVDGLWLSDTEYDTSWNGVWESAAHIDGRGWTAEFRIPFSQLAFRQPAGVDTLIFGINFYRYSPHHGESSNWSPRYRGLKGVVSHFNDLIVPAPGKIRRAEMTPYVAPRAGNDAARSTRGSIRAGADLRVGLGPNFNLTATVLPDFGQVEADPSQVNLSAFELFQPEQRPFFLEGLDVFRMNTSLPFSTRDDTFNNESSFYSRRVGRPPRGDIPSTAVTESIPGQTTLLGAAKLVGQTRSGWTVGVFSALTGSEEARISDADGSSRSWPVESAGVVSVARATRSFQDGDSSLGFFATDLHRVHPGSVLAAEEVRDAEALGVEAEHRFSERQYELRGWVLASRLTGSEAAIAAVGESAQHYFQRPDAPWLHEKLDGTSLSGIAAETRVSRVNGAMTWDLTARAVSPGFDVNELGFQRNSDWLLLAGAWKYQWFPAGGPIRAWTLGSSNLGVGWSWRGERRTRTADGYVSVDTRGYWTVRLSGMYEGTSLSPDRLRGGPAILLPPQTSVALSVLTDQRRASFVTLDVGASHEPGSGSTSISVSPFLNIRSSNRLQWSVGPSYRVDTVGWQYVGSAAAGTSTGWIVGRVRQETLSAAVRADLVLSPQLALQVYLQPFATVGRYDAFQRLASPRDSDAGRRFANLAGNQVVPDPAAGTIGFDIDGDGTIDTTLATPGGEERALNGSLVFRWEYRPGSFVTAAWNQRRDTTAAGAATSSAGALGSLFGDRPTNVVLVKVSRRFGS